MAAWLIAAIERLRPRGRRVVVAAAALLLLAGAIASLSLQAGRGRRAGRSVVIVRAPARRPAARPVPPRVRPPVSGSDLRLASRVAGQIVACYERFGPDEPWGFADPSGWKCSERYCEAWGRCPGGVGV